MYSEDYARIKLLKMYHEIFLQYYSQYDEIMLKPKKVPLSHTFFVTLFSEKNDLNVYMIFGSFSLILIVSNQMVKLLYAGTCHPPEKHKSRLVISRIPPDLLSVLLAH